MSKLTGSVVVVFLFCSFQSSLISAASAQERENNQRGEVRVKQSDCEVWKTSEALSRACNNPGTEVPMDLKRGSSKRVDFFHGVSVHKYEHVVVFSNNKPNAIKKEGEVLGEPELVPHVILLLVVMFFMVLLNLLVWRKGFDNRVVTIFAICFSVVACGLLYGVVLSSNFVGNLAFAVATAFAFFATVPILLTAIATLAGDFVTSVVKEKKKKIYKIANMAFFIFAILALLTNLF